MADPGTAATDKAVATVETRLVKVYKQAQKELNQTLKDFEEKFAEKQKRMEQKLQNGEITEAEYKKWLQGQVFQSNLWKQKIDQVTGVLADANRQALHIVNNEKMGVFAENANYQAYQVTKDTGMNLSFSLYDKDTVGKLIRERPELMPRKQLDGKKDRAWNRTKVANAVSQGVIQGESIPEIAKRIARDTASENGSAMTRYARTAMTSAQNAGRMETMERAKGMGIKCKKRWLATLDKRTRDAHADLDGQVVDVGEPFHSILGDIMFPGDPSADPANVWNCRCTLVYEYEDYKNENDERRDNENGEVIKNITYKEWKDSKDTETKKEGLFTRTIVQNVEKYNKSIDKINEKILRLENEYQQLYPLSLVKYGDDDYEHIIGRLDQVDKEIADQRSKISDIEKKRYEYLASKGTGEIQKAYGKIKTAHGIEDDAKRVNTITGDLRTQKNCGSCVLAYDSRRRGIDCEAELTYATGNSMIETWWENIKMQKSAMYHPTDARAEIEATAIGWGEGARGIVAVDWTRVSGHYFAFEVKDGKCVFVDPQVGIVGAEDLFDNAMPGSVEFARTDDKELTRAAYFSIRGGKK